MADAIPPENLRTAAITAEACIRIQAARDYGFIEGGPAIHVDRCEDVIAMAREHGHTWTEQEVTDHAVQLIAETNEEAHRG